MFNCTLDIIIMHYKDYLKKQIWGAWVTHSVKHSTLDFTSGCDVRVTSSSPMLGHLLGMEAT